MNKQIQIFDVLTTNEEEEQEFYNFFHKYKLDALFTNEHRASPITVPWSDMKGVINPNSSFHKTLKGLGDLLSRATDNKKYEQAVFRIIYESNHIRGLISRAQKLIDYDKNVMTDNKAHNLWNIVWYNKGLK